MPTLHNMKLELPNILFKFLSWIISNTYSLTTKFDLEIQFSKTSRNQEIWKCDHVTFWNVLTIAIFSFSFDRQKKEFKWFLLNQKLHLAKVWKFHERTKLCQTLQSAVHQRQGSLQSPSYVPNLDFDNRHPRKALTF